jgi:hypothetical protein
MSDQTAIETQLMLDGAPVTFRLINNPLIDDVLIGEMYAQATSIWRGDDLSNHRVSRDLRDYLIRLGIER